MFKMFMVAFSALVFGCAVTPTDNVYQPESAGCPEIEYRWTNDTGEHLASYAGSGGFCVNVSLDFSQDIPLQARCVTRDPSGEIVSASAWVDGITSTDVEKFREFCPVD